MCWQPPPGGPTPAAAGITPAFWEGEGRGRGPSHCGGKVSLRLASWSPGIPPAAGEAGSFSASLTPLHGLQGGEYPRCLTAKGTGRERCKGLGSAVLTTQQAAPPRPRRTPARPAFWSYAAPPRPRGCRGQRRTGSIIQGLLHALSSHAQNQFCWPRENREPVPTKIFWFLMWWITDCPWQGSSLAPALKKQEQEAWKGKRAGESRNLAGVTSAPVSVRAA